MTACTTLAAIATTCRILHPIDRGEQIEGRSLTAFNFNDLSESAAVLSRPARVQTQLAAAHEEMAEDEYDGLDPNL